MNTLWIAFRLAEWQIIKTDLRAVNQDRGAETTTPKALLRVIHSGIDQEQVSDIFKQAVIAGETYKMISIIVEDDLLDKLDRLDKRYGAAMKICRSWDCETGLRLGTERDEFGVITGTPIHDISKARLLRFIRAYDVDGNQIPATELTNVHSFAGEAPRVLE